MKKFIIGFIVLALTACSFGGQTELSRNKSKWQSANITSYNFDLNVGCFCVFRSLMPVKVEVRNGEVVSMTDVNGDAISLTDPNSEFILKYATMDRLFSELESDSVQKADKLTVSYDSTYGFPKEVAIDFIQQAADDELYLSASGFEPLP